MQQTDFKFVAVVHDDASTDGTAAVVREYAERYPDKIVAILEKENQYSKPHGLTREWMSIACSGGKYMAMCEGDDYWTDPQKLQKQVDFLDANPDFSVCYHPVKVLNQSTGEIFPDTLKDVPSETDIYDLVAETNYIHTPSVMYRYNPIVSQKFTKIGRVVVGDYLTHVLYAEHGKIKKLPDYMAVYRQGVGIWTGPNSNENKNMLLWIIACSKLSSLLDDPQVRWLLENQILSCQNGMLKEITTYEKRIEQLQASKAYRLGKFLLKPFGWMKRK